MNESPREVKISQTALAILLHNIFVASKDARIGFVDADQTLASLVKGMERDVWIKTEHLESALYYSNMLHEDGNFWHPLGLNFLTFKTNILPASLHFDNYFNTITLKGKP